MQPSTCGSSSSTGSAPSAISPFESLHHAQFAEQQALPPRQAGLKDIQDRIHKVRSLACSDAAVSIVNCPRKIRFGDGQRNSSALAQCYPRW